MGAVVEPMRPTRDQAPCTRRALVAGLALGAVPLAGTCVVAQSRRVVTLSDFARTQRLDGPRALQAALDHLGELGGGTLRIDGRFRGGIAVVRGSDLTIDGDGGTLVDTRLVIAPEARRIAVRDLTLLETRGDPASYLLDVSGQDCTFDRLSLVKEPMAGGYQGYIRELSAGCIFTELRLRGSNGLFVAGKRHTFSRFDFTSTLRKDMGGDDAFAIKGPGVATSDIVIEDGVVRGFMAAVSIGSEVGSNDETPGAGSVLRVRVSRIEADRCAAVCFIKPGALAAEWHGGRVADILLEDIALTDREGFMYGHGIWIIAARGAVVEGVVARRIAIAARAVSQDVFATSAIDIGTYDIGAPATVRNVDLQVSYDGAGSAGFPVEHIVRIEKANEARGRMADITIDIEGSQSRRGGIYIGGGLHDAVTIRRARLRGIGLSPQTTLAAGGIWADSRVRLGDVQLDVVRGARLGGRALRP